MITRQDVANKLIDYLYYRMSLAELVHWAEQVMMEEEFDERDLSLLRDIVARLGLSPQRSGRGWRWPGNGYGQHSSSTQRCTAICSVQYSRQPWYPFRCRDPGSIYR